MDKTGLLLLLLLMTAAAHTKSESRPDEMIKYTSMDCAVAGTMLTSMYGSSISNRTPEDTIPRLIKPHVPSRGFDITQAAISNVEEPSDEAAEPIGVSWKIERLAFLCDPYDFRMDGPALQALGTVGKVALGTHGEIYFTLDQNIFVLDRGRIHHLAGNGMRGFRDGPAGIAMFNFGGRGYRYSDIAVDRNTGYIYVADGYNQRIRKIYKDNTGMWQVKTFAGGGKIQLGPNQTANALKINLHNVVAVAVDNEGNVYTSPWGKIVKITPKGQATVPFVFPKDGYPRFINIVDMDADSLGNIYGAARDSIVGYFKYARNGKFVRLTYLGERDPNATVDGPIETATFHCIGNVAVDPMGSTVYAGGGDESKLRRIKGGRVSTLTEKGSWVELQKRNIGWKLGGVRAVDDEGNIYMGQAQRIGIPLRKLIRTK